MMDIRINHNGTNVFDGTSEQWILDNENDFVVVGICERLNESDVVEWADFHSGHWVVYRKTDEPKK